MKANHNIQNSNPAPKHFFGTKIRRRLLVCSNIPLRFNSIRLNFDWDFKTIGFNWGYILHLDNQLRLHFDRSKDHMEKDKITEEEEETDAVEMVLFQVSECYVYVVIFNICFD